MTTLNKIRRVWARPAGSGCMAEAGGAGGDGSPGGRGGQSRGRAPSTWGSGQGSLSRVCWTDLGGRRLL